MHTESSIFIQAIQGDNRNATIVAQTNCITGDRGKVSLIFLLVTGVAVTLENLLGIVVILKRPALQNTANVFIVSLATTDVIVGVTWTLTPLSELAFKELSPDLHEVVQTYCVLVAVHMSCLSILHIAVIAVERYLYIARPFIYQRYVTKTAVSATIVILWVSVTACFLIFGIQTFVKGVIICTVRQVPVTWVFYVAMPVYVLSTIIGCMAYFRISVIALRQRRSTGVVQVVHRRGSDGNQESSSKAPSVQRSTERLGEVMKSVKFFGIVFGVFLVMTGPGALCLILQHFVEMERNWYTVMVGGITFNSAMNFIILTLINSTFRTAVKQTFCRCFHE